MKSADNSFDKHRQLRSDILKVSDAPDLLLLDAFGYAALAA
jgi:hypothetical protein